MKILSSTLKGQTFAMTLTLVVAFCMLPLSTPAGEKWPGVDETVIEKYAEEHGREAAELLINTDQGDLLLFVFLLAGAVGGFFGGYYWRMLVAEKPPNMAMQNKF